MAFSSRFGFVARRANVHADAATGAIFRRDLQRVLQPFPFRQPRLDDLNDDGAPARTVRIINFAANDRVRADQHAFPALDADRRIPDRNFDREVALLELRSARRETSRR